MGETKLFVRTTTISETDNGVQASRINCYLYDNEDIAHKAYEQLVPDDQWDELIETGEGFYKVEEDGYINTFFVEVRKV